MSKAEKAAMGTGYPDSRIVAYTMGIVSEPRTATNERMPMYGTLLSGYESPMFSKSK